MVDFKEIIDRMKSVSGWTQKRLAAEVFKISDKNLSNKIGRNTIDIESIIEWSVNNSVDLNWLLTGRPDPGAGGHISGPGSRLDVELLKDINTVIEKGLAESGLELAPGDKAEAVALLYELYYDSGKNIEEGTVKRYLKLVG
jgi:hypothetical protein